ncbi:MAG TPA: AarF/UbiB family protein [Opitutaceae bacterium]|nr:AarF/UbiB family protein [Opitutaceae bacterium]
MPGVSLKPFDLLANAVRAKEIVLVLVRHGFAEIIEQIETPGAWWQRFVPTPKERRSTVERIRLAAEELGPTFIKFCQLLSMRPDLVPQPLVLELQKLQDAVQPLPFDAIQEVVSEELECDPAEVFSEFNQTAVASASLAQVYFARLKVDGRAVAVKVQRPDLQKVVEADLDLIAFFAARIHHYVPRLRPFDLPAIVEEIRAGLIQELDFRHEARNQQYFNAQNPFPDKVFAPEVVGSLTARRMLVMERVEGRRVEQAQLAPEQAKALASAGATSLLHQIVISGFFHADPHAGNVLVTGDGRLCLLDWGLAGHLTRRLRHALADLLLAVAGHDAEQVVQVAMSLAGPGAKPDYRTMEKEVTITLRENLNFAIGYEQIGRLILKLIEIFGRNGISVSRDYALVAKSVLSIEELGRALDPEFDLRRVARPVLRELHRERWSPRALLGKTRTLLATAFGRLGDLPIELDRLLRRLEQDDLTVNFQHRGLEGLNEALRAASNRIALGVIIGALIIGSSQIVTTGISPYLFGYPLLGIVGYLLSALLGLWVIWDIFRHGRHK